MHEIFALDTSLPVAIVAVGLLLSLLVVLRLRALLVAAPLAAMAMSMPQIEGLPFIREFGYFLGATGVIALATSLVRSAAADRQQLLRATTDPVLLALCAYMLVGVSSTVINFQGIGVIASRVMIVHLLAESFLLALVLAIVVRSRQMQDVNLFLYSLASAGLLATLVGMAVSLIPFFYVDTVDPFAYFGFFYYCRVQLSFHGPVHYSAFVAAAVPLMIYCVSRLGGGLLRTAYLAGVCLAPLAVIAGGSRPARLALVVSLIVLAFNKRLRPLSIGVLVLAGVLFAASYQYRCLSDIAAVNAPYLLPEDARLPNSNMLSASEYFADDHRSELRAAALDSMFGSDPPASVASDPDAPATSTLTTIALGHGPGLAAYDTFGIGSHTLFVDLLVERGAVGWMLFAGAAGFAVWRVARRMFRRGPEGAMATAVVATVFPLLAAGVAFDIRTWAFFWVYVALFIVVGRLFESVDGPAIARDTTVRT